jgi:hypothetical protein
MWWDARQAFSCGRSGTVALSHRLAEQVALFAGARVVAGFGGSLMFGLMHAQRLESLVVISHKPYVARNEHRFASVLGGELHYFWQPSDIEPPKVGGSKASEESWFAFDFTTQGMTSCACWPRSEPMPRLIHASELRPSWRINLGLVNTFQDDCAKPRPWRLFFPSRIAPRRQGCSIPTA